MLPDDVALSPDVVQLLRALMDPDPNSRMTAAAALQSSWLRPTVREGADPGAKTLFMQHFQLLSQQRCYRPGQVSLHVSRPSPSAHSFINLFAPYGLGLDTNFSIKGLNKCLCCVMTLMISLPSGAGAPS